VTCLHTERYLGVRAVRRPGTSRMRRIAVERCNACGEEATRPAPGRSLKLEALRAPGTSKVHLFVVKR
jgi:hypothetical protein